LFRGDNLLPERRKSYRSWKNKHMSGENNVLIFLESDKCQEYEII
jgi:hypothetical protein